MNLSTNDAPSDIQDRVSAELHSAARAIPTNGDPARAFARAEQRRQRRTFATAAAGLIAVGGLTTGALMLRPEPTANLVAAAANTEPETGADLPLSLEWRVADADVDWPSASFVGADGYRYALSTAPGSRYGDLNEHDRIPQAVYRTDDGENWESINQTGPQLTGLYSRDGVLYSVSTSTDASGAVINEILRSDDNGAGWTAAEVPFEFSDVNDPNDVLYTVGISSVSLAVGNDQMIATATRSSWIDGQKLAAFMGIAATNLYPDVRLDDSGKQSSVLLRDYSDCQAAVQAAEDAGESLAEDLPACIDPTVVGEATFAELGISGDLDQTRSAITADGVTWAPVDVPALRVWFAGGVYVAEGLNEFGNSSYSRSTDGVTWTAMDIGLSTSLEIIGTSNDLLVGQMFGEESGQAPVAVSADGGASWRNIYMDELSSEAQGSSFVSTVAAGDLGIVVVIGTRAENSDVITWMMATSRDGSSWTTQRADDIADIGGGSAGWAFVDADRIGVVFSGTTRNPDGSVTALTLMGTPTR